MNEKNKNTTPNVPKFKFNMYWIYGAIFVVLIGVSFLNEASLSTQKISTNRFFKILESNDVNKILIINKNIAEVYIKKEAETKDKYNNNPVPLFLEKVLLYFNMILEIFKILKIN
jgi:cell division protease FtsH